MSETAMTIIVSILSLIILGCVSKILFDEFENELANFVYKTAYILGTKCKNFAIAFISQNYNEPDEWIDDILDREEMYVSNILKLNK